MSAASQSRAALVLAGGLSTRMGRDKGLLELEGQPLVVWVIERMRTVAEEIAVSTSLANDAAYRQVVPTDVRCVPDISPQTGPLGGWRSALPALGAEYVVVAPCDAPFYSPALAEHLFERAQSHDGAVPRLGKFFEPLHGAYRRLPLLGAVEKCLAMGLNRPVHTYAHLDIVEVGEAELREVDPELDSFRSANTPEEFKRVKQRSEELARRDGPRPRGPT